MRSPVLLGIVFLLAASAADRNRPFDIKPGLWEMRSSIQFLTPAFPDTTAATRPLGNTFPLPGNNISYPRLPAVPLSACVTNGTFAQAFAEAHSQAPMQVCTQKVRSSSAFQVKIHLECTQTSGNKTISDIVIKRLNAEEIKGAGTMTFAAGHAFQHDWTMTGKFVSPDCRDAKPSVSQ